MALRIPSQDRPGPRLLLKRYPFAFVADEIAFVGTNMLTDTLVTAGVILATTDEFLALDIVPYDTSLAPSDNAMFQVIKHPPPLQENYQGAESGEEEYEEFSYEPDMTMPDRWSVYVLDDEPADEEEEAVWPERDPSVTLEQVYALAQPTGREANASDAKRAMERLAQMPPEAWVAAANDPAAPGVLLTALSRDLRWGPVLLGVVTNPQTPLGTLAALSKVLPGPVVANPALQLHMLTDPSAAFLRDFHTQVQMAFGYEGRR